jgi:hypothetical protein
MWLLLSHLALAQSTWPEPEQWPAITAPPTAHAQICDSALYVENGVAVVRGVTGCSADAQAAFRAGIAGWMFPAGATGELRVAVRFPELDDPAPPPPHEPPARIGLETRKQVKPSYPEVVDPGIPVRCIVHVDIEKNGIPFQGYVTQCPAEFHEAALDAIMKWRWYPPIGGEGAPVRASTKVGIAFEHR